MAGISVHHSESDSEDTVREFVQLTNCEDGNCPGFGQWADTGDFSVRGYRVAQADKQPISPRKKISSWPPAMSCPRCSRSSSRG